MFENKFVFKVKFWVKKNIDIINYYFYRNEI